MGREERPIEDKNPLPKLMCQKRLFLPPFVGSPKSLQNLIHQTQFDFVMFLARAEGADVGAECSIK